MFHSELHTATVTWSHNHMQFALGSHNHALVFMQFKCQIWTLFNELMSQAMCSFSKRWILQKCRCNKQMWQQIVICHHWKALLNFLWCTPWSWSGMFSPANMMLSIDHFHHPWMDLLSMIIVCLIHSRRSLLAFLITAVCRWSSILPTVPFFGIFNHALQCLQCECAVNWCKQQCQHVACIQTLTKN